MHVMAEVSGADRRAAKVLLFTGRHGDATFGTMNQPVASFLMPCRDASATVEAAVRSIFLQTREDWELLLVDDGSLDDSVRRAADLAGTDPRVRILRRQREGLVAALNAGVQAASANLILRMDADDICHPQRLELMIQRALLEPELAVVGSLVRIEPADHVTPGMRHYIDWLNSVVLFQEITRDIFIESPFAHPSVMLRRDAVLAVGGYRDGPFPEDYDLWLRMHAAGHAMAKVPEVLLEWHDGPGRLTRTDPRYSPDAFRNLKAQHLAATFLGTADQVQIWGAGPDGRKWRKALAPFGITVCRHFDIDPRKIGRILEGNVPVMNFRDIGTFKGCPLLVAVGVKGARALIRRHLADLGWIETVEFRCVQ